MAALSTLDLEARGILSIRIEELDGVVRALVDADTGSIWIVCDATADRDTLDDELDGALRECGVDPTDVELRFAAEAGDGALRQRIRFESIDSDVSPSGRTSAKVRLSWRGQLYTGESAGEAGHAIELRTAAQATLRALDQLVGEDDSFRLIGVKEMRAFDAEMIVVSVHHRGEAVQRFVGAVLATSNPLEGAALAVLHALNRKLGNMLATTD